MTVISRVAIMAIVLCWWLLGPYGSTARSGGKCSAPEWRLEKISVVREEDREETGGDTHDTSLLEDTASAWREEDATWPESASFIAMYPGGYIEGEGVTLELRLISSGAKSVRR